MSPLGARRSDPNYLAVLLDRQLYLTARCHFTRKRAGFTDASFDSSQPRNAMARCEHCGNDYDKSFEVVMAGEAHVFDSFECAIHALAPLCNTCKTRIIGHGLESDGKFYCCAHCAKRDGESTLRDRATATVNTLGPR
jgi:hypothetical protein